MFELKYRNIIREANLEAVYSTFAFVPDVSFSKWFSHSWLLLFFICYEL